MDDFWECKFDVFVLMMIIEIGFDILNVNMIIIDCVDKYGFS